MANRSPGKPLLAFFNSAGRFLSGNINEILKLKNNFPDDSLRCYFNVTSIARFFEFLWYGGSVLLRYLRLISLLDN